MLDIQRKSDESVRARTIGATWVSTVLHAAVVVLVAAIARHTGDVPERPEETRAPSAQIVWIEQPTSGTDGGRYGNKSPEPPNVAERPGRDPLTVPVRRSPGDRPATVDREPPSQEINIPALPAASGLRDVPGIVADVIAVSIAPGGQKTGRGAGPEGGLGLDRGPGNSAGDGGRGQGGHLVSPEVIRQVRPNYTTSAMHARVRGLVVMDAIVLPDGSVGDVKIVRSLDRTFGLDEEAVKAVKRWRFRPGTRAGDPVPMLVSVEMMFELR